MEINVSQLLQEPIGSTREYIFDDTIDITGDGKERDAHGECKLLRAGRGILVNCTLDTEVELTCGRCLTNFRLPLKIKFEEEFLPTIDIASGMPFAPSEDGVAFTIDDHHILDLTEPARQYGLTAIPIKPLCQADCAGLCQKCGKNLNHGDCGCPDDDIDPRWAELTNLR